MMKQVSILTAALFCLAATTLCSAKTGGRTGMAAPQISCSGHGDPEGMTMQDAVDSPLYKLLQSKLGEPLNCAIAMTEENEVLTVNFAKSVSLTFTSNTVLELSQDEVALPAGSAVVSLEEAVNALKAIEKDNTPKGMGVKWDKLKATGDGDFVAEGKTCNAKAHVQVSGGVVVGFGFSSSC